MTSPPQGEVLASPAQAAGKVRALVWMFHMALPLLALWLLLVRPRLDVRWEHHPGHFWLVFSVAAVNVVLAMWVAGAARARSDPRLILVSFAFTLAAGFLLLHALATPGVLVAGSNGGFEIATPVGLALASLFFAAASLEVSPERAAWIVRSEPVIRLALLGVMVAWGVVSLAELPPLAEPLAERAVGPLGIMAALGIAAYLLAAIGFLSTHRHHPAVMLVALITAATLLAEALATTVWARAWQLSWWLWHLLMAAAFGFVAYSGYVQYKREGSAFGIFDGIASRQTVLAVREEYGGALETLTNTLQRSASMRLSDDELDLITAGLRARFSLTEGQTEVLARAASALAAERDQARRLGALARFGGGARIEHGEEGMLDLVVGIVAEGFAPDVMRIGLPGSNGLAFPDRYRTGEWSEDGETHTVSIEGESGQHLVLEFARPEGRFEAGDIAMMETLGAELAISLDNVRLYDQVDMLFRRYLSPDVAETLRRDPSRSELGGSVVELTALFADLRGFTSFSEGTVPEEVASILNAYFGKAVPIILRNGGTIVQFMGDALLAVFDAPTPRPDHAFRAARAGLALQDAVAEETASHPGWPRFRIGINSGPALVGNIGSDQFRSFNVVGDAINVASRLQEAAEPGTVVIAAATLSSIADRARVTPLGALEVRGKDSAVDAFRLDGLSEG